MQVNVPKAALLRELSHAQSITDAKASIPILGNVLLEAKDGRLSIAATDLELSIRCGCEATVGQPGAITVPARKLFEIVRALPDEDVQLTIDSGIRLGIICGRSRFQVAGLSREDYPALPSLDPGASIDLPAVGLASLIERTEFAITSEDARYYLAGALLVVEEGRLAMVATDGHRLAYAGKPHAMNGSEPVRVLVPRKAMSEIARLMEGSESVSFSQTANHLVFTAAGRMLACKMIEGQFPAWEKVIKAAGDKLVTLATAQLGAVMRRVSLLASERGRTAKLTLQPGMLEVSASSPDVGSATEEMPVEYAGEPVTIALNAQYILDFCRVAGAEVTLALRDSEAQATFTASGGGIDYVYVVMPMRL